METNDSGKSSPNDDINKKKMCQKDLVQTYVNQVYRYGTCSGRNLSFSI